MPSYNSYNIKSLFRIIGDLPGNIIHDSDGYCFVKTSGSSWPNKIFDLKVTAQNLSNVLTKIEIESVNNSVPSVILVQPGEIEEELISLIVDRKYSHSTWSAMTFDLKKEFPKVEEYTTTIDRVENREMLRKWLKIVVKELMQEQPLSEELFEHLLNNNACYLYLALENNQPVGTSLLYVNNNTAGIYLVSTSENHRKKGIGSQVTLACLKKAKELKCTQVDIQATELGKPVYTSLGFKEKGLINVFRINKS